MNMKNEGLLLESFSVSSHVKGMNELSDVYDALSGFPEALFSKLLQRIHEFTCIGRLCGESKNCYLISEFTFLEGNIVIFFPWKINGGEKRLVTVHTQAGVKEDQIRYIVKEVLDILWWEYFSRSHHDPQRNLPEKIFGRILGNGEKIVPWWYVDVRAYLCPVLGGDMIASHVAAKEYFQSKGWNIAH